MTVSPRDSAAISVNALFFILFGCFSVIYGILLIPIDSGALVSDSGAASAMFVITFAIMIGFLGLTPVGTFTQTTFLFLLGLVLVLVGSVAFIAPGTLHGQIDYLLAAMLLGLGLIRLPIFLYRRWRHRISVPTTFTVLYVAMHLLSLALGLQILFAWSRGATIPLLIALGVCMLLLARQANDLGSREPASVPANPHGTASAPASTPMGLSLRYQLMVLLAASLIFCAVMVILGIMGVVPYSSRSSILFVFITAMQVMLVGDTPVRSFAPSWPLAFLGIFIASTAMVAAIIPGLIDGFLGPVIGVSNFLAATFGYVRLVDVARRAKSSPAGPTRRAMWKTIIVADVVYFLLLLFGLNMLVPGLIPGLLMLVVLVFSGITLAWLSFLLNRVKS